MKNLLTRHVIPTALSLAMVVCLGYSSFPNSNAAAKTIATSSTVNQINSTNGSRNQSNDSIEKVSLSSVQTMADGGTKSIYYVGGVKNTMYTPPDGFQPVHATDGQLKMYGFKERPKEKQAYQSWINKYSGFTEKSKGNQQISKNYKVNRINKVNGTKNKINDVTSASANWAGYVALTDQNNYNFVKGQFTQSDIATGAVYPSYQSSWVGIGGCFSNQLIQAGTEMDNNGYLGSHEFSIWYEYLDAAHQNPAINIDSISPGQDMSVAVEYSGGKAHFSFYSKAKGFSRNIELDNAQEYYSGNCAEWIDERPYVNGNFAQLAKFTPVNWDSCAVSTNLGGTLNSIATQKNQRLIMMNSENTILAQPSALGNSGNRFTDTFYNAS